jgi:hypothetical protein
VAQVVDVAQTFVNATGLDEDGPLRVQKASVAALVTNPFIPISDNQDERAPYSAGQRHAAGAQELHTDLPAEQCGCTITYAMEPCSILVVPFSHSGIGCLPFFRERSENPDKAVGELLPQYRLVRVTMKAGDMLLLHGNVVHAGDCSSSSSP